MTRTTILNLRQSTERIGGAEVVIRRTVVALDPARFRSIVVCLKKPGMDLRAVADLLADSGAEYVELESAAQLDVKALRAVLRLIDRYAPDVVHCHDPKTDFLGFMLRLLRPRLPVVTTLHGWVIASRRGALYKRLDQWFARFFHAAVAVSPAIAEEARARGVRRVTLIENGIPVDEWRARQSDSAAVVDLPRGGVAVGFLGRICREKGPLEFIHTAALVAATHADAVFLVAGEGPMLDDMRAAAQAAGIADRCRFLGQLPLDRVPAFLGALRVLLSTSETEGIPNALLEAAVLGVPIVASAVGGVPRVVAHGKTGFLAPFGARAELADYVVRLLDDAALHQALAAEATARMRREFSIQGTAARLAAVYDRVVATGG